MKKEGFKKNCKQYQERWINYINPSLSKNPLSEIEIDDLFENYYYFDQSGPTFRK